MEKRRVIKTGVTILLAISEVAAKKNAEARCKGFLYEPEIPKKLKTAQK